MSAFTSLFGNSKVDESVKSLLKKSAGPVDRPAFKSRTVVEVPAQSDKEDSSDQYVEEEKTSDGYVEDEKTSDEHVEGEKTAEVQASESKRKLHKKQKKMEENEGLEDEYMARAEEKDTSKANKLKKPKAQKPSEENSGSIENRASGDSSSDSDSEQGSEGAQDGQKQAPKTQQAKSVDLKQSELEKAERTVFVGNVSNKVISSKSTYKDFKKKFDHLGAIESIRFRSISFDEALPRKIAFARKSLHNSRDTVNAYVVFKDKESSLKAPALLNATVFDHNHIRVDHVAHPSPKDNKRTIFVGNLDFEEKEETLWRYFNAKIDDDVESVRVVRDAKSNMGKGFALVQFKDTLSVSKALLLNDKPMAEEEGKKNRKLRIMRAKAHAKPSVISPNHIDNIRASKKTKVRLTDDQKTKIGRARKLLGKADRNSAGQMVAEGARASKGQQIAGIKGLKSAKGKVKKPRITKRSTQFKSDKKQFKSLK